MCRSEPVSHNDMKDDYSKDTPAERRQRELDDCNNEIAGRETGRIRRFVVGDAGPAEAARKRRDRDEAVSRLMHFLTDPVYRARYERASVVLADAEQATERVLSQLEHQIAAAQIELNGIQDAAARLPDGTRVYRDANGVVRREDGAVVDDMMVATIVWKGDEPRYEAYLAAEDALDAHKAQRDEVSTYLNTVLGPARDRLDDADDPPSLDELDQILEAIEAEMPAAVSAQMPTPETPGPSTDHTTSVALPTLPLKP